MVTVTYPSHKAMEAAKKFKRMDLPDFIKKWQIFTTSSGTQGIKNYQLIFCEKGKGDDALLYIYKNFAPFIEIEGFEIKIEVLMGVKDSMSILGM
ncbi:MAG: hypothetical protein ACFE8A_02385 [Candidatus Hodarchaeota archaeon]